MPIYNKLKYPWLRDMRLIPPLFKKGDRVRPRCGKVKPCYPSKKALPMVFDFSARSYGIKELIFHENKKNWTGYRVELVERPGEWFWAMHFRKAEFRGWIAPASDLMRTDSEFFRMGMDCSWLWSSPCCYCRTPHHWQLLEHDPRCICSICGKLEHDHRKTRHLETLLRNLDSITPGKKVRPIGPAVFPKMLSNDQFIEPLDVNTEYVVKDFFRGDESLVTLHGIEGVYSVKFLEAV